MSAFPIARRSLAAVAVVLSLVLLPGAASAELPDVVRVEEDWELVVGTPSALVSAPQIVCTFAPVCHLQDLHATFEINHQSQPGFVAGGLQLQLWEGKFPLSSQKFPHAAELSQDGEVIRWTQTMALKDGTLTFEIVDGSSETWGPFGGQGYLKAATSSILPNLNQYNPLFSIERSGVSYAPNLVDQLKLTRVRLHLSTGEILEDDSVYSVLTQN